MHGATIKIKKISVVIAVYEGMIVLEQNKC